MIQIRKLALRFRSGAGPWQQTRQVLEHVDFEAADGAITGLLGPNGAGKTTTLRVLAGILAPDQGEACVDGFPVATARSEAMARLGMLTDGRGLYPRLSAQENIAYFGRLHGMTPDRVRRRMEHLARVLDMADLMERPVAGFSQGERMKTALARAMVHDPPNIVLDEPTNGLDVMATRSLREVLLRLRDDEGKCILLSTHIMQEVERLCDRVVIMAGGKTLADGTVQGLRQAAGAVDFEEAFVRFVRPPAAGPGPQNREGD